MNLCFVVKLVDCLWVLIYKISCFFIYLLFIYFCLLLLTCCESVTMMLSCYFLIDVTDLKINNPMCLTVMLVYFLIVDYDVGVFVYYCLDVDVFIIILLACLLSACCCILKSFSFLFFFFLSCWFVVLLYIRVEWRVFYPLFGGVVVVVVAVVADLLCYCYIFFFFLLL